MSVNPGTCRRPVALTLLVLLLSCLAVAVTAQPAAAALCYGSTCNGKDPNAQGCSAVNVVATEVWSDSFSVAMRYSSGCAARWTRMIIDDYLRTCCIPAYISIERQLWTPYGDKRTHYYVKKIGAGLEGSFWTPMVQNSSDDRARSCYEFGDSTPDNCSGWIY
jgi:hypothetical protein